MKVFHVFMVVGAALGLVGLNVEPPTASPVSLVGEITDATSGEPLEMVQVLIEGEKVYAQTSEEGVFRLSSDGVEGPLELILRHQCYHTVRVEIDESSGVETRQIRLGMPFNYEKHRGVSPPLGGCRPPGEGTGGG